MKIRWMLILTGITSALLGALVAYLVLAVPNDLRADALLKQARTDVTDGENTKGRATLLRIVQQYPRTDAAAAATAALVALEKRERDELARSVHALQTQHAQQVKLIAALQKNFIDLKNAQPKPATVQTAAAQPAPAKKAAPKKKTPPKKRRR